MEVLLVLIGFVFGMVATLILLCVSAGTLRVDHSDPTEAPYLFLELDKPVESIVSKKMVLFKVTKKNFISENE